MSEREIDSFCKELLLKRSQREEITEYNRNRWRALETEEAARLTRCTEKCATCGIPVEPEEYECIHCRKDFGQEDESYGGTA